MASTTVLYASGTPVTGNDGPGSWSGLAAATGAPDGVYAVYTSPDPAEPWVFLPVPGAQAAIGAQPASVDSAVLTVWLHVDKTRNWPAAYAQLFAGPPPDGIAIGAQPGHSLTISTTAGNSQSLTLSGADCPAWDQLPSLGAVLQLDKNGFSHPASAYVDAVSLVVNYTP